MSDTREQYSDEPQSEEQEQHNEWLDSLSREDMRQLALNIAKLMKTDTPQKSS